MKKLVRTLFGLDNGAGNRKVVGHPAKVNIKEIGYIRDSNARLTQLHKLYNRYVGTTQERKINAVYEKTKNIHSFLIAKNRGPELELFHLQNTDHFINTFTLLADVYDKKEKIKATATPELVEEGAHNNVNPALSNKPAEPAKAAINGSKADNREPTIATAKSETKEPWLPVSAIAIDTYAKVSYVRVDATWDLKFHEIGITSTYQEKEYFLATIAARVGLYKPDVSYVGNARVILPDTSGAGKATYLPVINWRGCMYAVNLNDYRLFPVKINRNNR